MCKQVQAATTVHVIPTMQQALSHLPPRCCCLIMSPTLGPLHWCAAPVDLVSDLDRPAAAAAAPPGGFWPGSIIGLQSMPSHLEARRASGHSSRWSAHLCSSRHDEKGKCMCNELATLYCLVNGMRTPWSGTHLRNSRHHDEHCNHPEL